MDGQITLLLLLKEVFARAFVAIIRFLFGIRCSPSDGDMLELSILLELPSELLKTSFEDIPIEMTSNPRHPLRRIGFDNSVFLSFWWWTALIEHQIPIFVHFRA